jgi:hypothetical protein
MWRRGQADAARPAASPAVNRLSTASGRESLRNALGLLLLWRRRGLRPALKDAVKKGPASEKPDKEKQEDRAGRRADHRPEQTAAMD